MVVPPIGALAERVAASGGGWVLADDEWRDDASMLQRIATLLASENADSHAAAAARAKATAQPTLAAMTEATIAIWRDALSRAPAESSTASLRAISAERCLCALHYAPWSLPEPAAQPPAAPTVPKPNGALAVVARAALSIHHTFAGRVLYRLAPKPLVARLRQRL